MMVRLNVSKHQRNARKRGGMSMSNQLNSITHFGDITALTGGEAEQVCLYTGISQLHLGFELPSLFIGESLN